MRRRVKNWWGKRIRDKGRHPDPIPKPDPNPEPDSTPEPDPLPEPKPVPEDSPEEIKFRRHDSIARDVPDLVPDIGRKKLLPTDVKCCLTVEICNMESTESRYHCTQLLDCCWNDSKQPEQFKRHAESIAEEKCREENSTSSCYLVSVTYRVVEQRQAGDSEIEDERFSPMRAVTTVDHETSSRFDIRRHKVYVSRTLPNPQTWENSWQEDLPLDMAKLLLSEDSRQKNFYLEVTFKYQAYIPHSKDCDGGTGCHESVSKSLIQQKVSVHDKKQSFVPHWYFAHYFTTSVVDHLLQRCRVADPDQSGEPLNNNEYLVFVESVQQFACRMLAICIHAGVKLPLLYELTRHSVQGQTIADVDLPLNDNADQFPDSWDPTSRDKFLNMQYPFCAYSFRSTKDQDTIEEIGLQQVIPFLEKNHIGQGAYSHVYGVKIHEQHHEFYSISGCFAVKTFKSLDSLNWDRERKILEELADCPHEHLTPFLAAWKNLEGFHILFPQAEMDLDVFLSGDRAGTRSERVRWVIEEMLGLSDALDAIHRWFPTDHRRRPLDQKEKVEINEGSGLRQRTIYHQDLKLKNILVFRTYPERYTLKIADFGLAQAVEQGARGESGSKSLESSAGDKEFVPPEKMLTSTTRRSADIWSFGCIFLVILIWLFHDKYHDALLNFAAARYGEKTREMPNTWQTYAFWRAVPFDSEAPGVESTIQINEGVYAGSLRSGIFQKRNEREQFKVGLKNCVWDSIKDLRQKATELNKAVLEDLVTLVHLDMLEIIPRFRKTAPEIRSELKNLLQRALMELRDPKIYDSASGDRGIIPIEGISNAGNVSNINDFEEEDRNVNSIDHIPSGHMAARKSAELASAGYQFGD